MEAYKTNTLIIAGNAFDLIDDEAVRLDQGEAAQGKLLSVNDDGMVDTIDPEVNTGNPPTEGGTSKIYVNVDEHAPTFSLPEVNDSSISTGDTWSSAKIVQELNVLRALHGLPALS